MQTSKNKYKHKSKEKQRLEVHNAKVSTKCQCFAVSLHFGQCIITCDKISTDGTGTQYGKTN